MGSAVRSQSLSASAYDFAFETTPFSGVWYELDDYIEGGAYKWGKYAYGQWVQEPTVDWITEVDSNNWYPAGDGFGPEFEVFLTRNNINNSATRTATFSVKYAFRSSGQSDGEVDTWLTENYTLTQKAPSFAIWTDQDNYVVDGWAFDVGAHDINIACRGTFNSIYTWEVETDADWIVGLNYELITHSNGTVTPKAIVYGVKENQTGASRVANIVLRYMGGCEAKFTVTQTTPQPRLSIDKTEGIANKDAGNIQVNVSFGGAVGELSVTSNASWATPTLSSDSSVLAIAYDANTSEENRTAEISVLSSSAGLSATYTLIQTASITGELSGGRTLTTWQYSADEAYVVMRYLRESTVVFEIWDSALYSKVGEATISDFSGNIDDISVFCVNDVVYIAHEDVRPRKIVRYKDSSIESGYRFEIEYFNIKIDPVLDEYADRNVFEVKEGVYAAGDAVRIDEVALSDGQISNGASLMLFYGNEWRATGGQMLMLKRPTEMMKCYGFLYSGSENTSSSVTQVPAPETVYSDENGGVGKSSPWLFAFGKITVETNGKWSGRVVVDLWKPDMDVDEDGNPVNPEQLAVIEVSNAMSNKSISRDLTIVGSRIRVRCEERQRAKGVNVVTDSSLNISYKEHDNDTGCYVTVSNAQEIPIYLRIKTIHGSYAYCTAIHPFEGGFTSSSFAEGAWCAGRYGYPRAVGVFQERMVFGGNKVKPCTLWCSKTGDWANFVQGSESTSPIFATANTDNIDAIQWLQVAKSYIMFGSLSGEWYFGASDGGAVKPSNYSFQRLSNFGSTKGVDAVLFGESTLVAKNGGRQVVDVSYNTLSEQGSGTDLSLFAAHLFEDDSIKAMVSTISPNSILWVLTKSGKLLSFTYEANNNVFAWARHEVLGGISSITSFRRGERDVLAMLVNDGGKLVLAELDPYRGDDYKNDGTPEERELIYMDEAADGSFVRYESRIIPTPIMFPDGIAYGRKVSFRNADIYLKTHNGGFDGDVWADGTQFSVKLGDEQEVNCDNGWLVTNELKVFGENKIVLPVSSGWDDKAIMDIRTDYPAPLTITAIGADFAVGG